MIAAMADHAEFTILMHGSLRCRRINLQVPYMNRGGRLAASIRACPKHLRLGHKQAIIKVGEISTAKLLSCMWPNASTNPEEIPCGLVNIGSFERQLRDIYVHHMSCQSFEAIPIGPGGERGHQDRKVKARTRLSRHVDGLRHIRILPITHRTAMEMFQIASIYSIPESFVNRSSYFSWVSLDNHTPLAPSISQ